MFHIHRYSTPILELLKLRKTNGRILREEKCLKKTEFIQILFKMSKRLWSVSFSVEIHRRHFWRRRERLPDVYFGNCSWLPLERLAMLFSCITATATSRSVSNNGQHFTRHHNRESQFLEGRHFRQINSNRIIPATRMTQ